MTAPCPYCAGTGIWFGCGDESCCPVGDCQTCDGAGVVEEYTA